MFCWANAKFPPNSHDALRFGTFFHFVHRFEQMEQVFVFRCRMLVRSNLHWNFLPWLAPTVSGLIRLIHERVFRFARYAMFNSVELVETHVRYLVDPPCLWSDCGEFGKYRTNMIGKYLPTFPAFLRGSERIFRTTGKNALHVLEHISDKVFAKRFRRIRVHGNRLVFHATQQDPYRSAPASSPIEVHSFAFPTLRVSEYVCSSFDEKNGRCRQRTFIAYFRFPSWA